MRQQLLAKLRDVVRPLLDEAGASDDVPDFALEATRHEQHGDFACNAAMLLARPLRRSPREIAAALVERLADADGMVERAEGAGPGFVNLWLSEDRWRDVLRAIVEAGASYGRSAEGAGQHIQVEYVSANPTGPLSTGHGRQAVLGDCLARLLEFTGYQVTREYYFNNGGRQMRVLGESVKARYLEALGLAAPPPPEALATASDGDAEWPTEVDGLPVALPRDGYQGAYSRAIAERLRAERGDALVDEPGDGIFRETAEKLLFSEIRETLERIRVEFDVYTNESSLYEDGKIDQTLAGLRERGVVYEADGAVWLRSTELGLDRDRVLVRSNGEPTYITPDIAYHCEKLRRGFDRVSDGLGADHIAQLPFVRAAVTATGARTRRTTCSTPTHAHTASSARRSSGASRCPRPRSSTRRVWISRRSSSWSRSSESSRRSSPALPARASHIT